MAVITVVRLKVLGIAIFGYICVYLVVWLVTSFSQAFIVLLFLLFPLINAMMLSLMRCPFCEEYLSVLKFYKILVFGVHDCERD